MSNVIKLKDRKKLSTLKRIIADLEKIIQVLELTQRGLMVFKNYRVSQKIMSMIEIEKNLLYIQFKKCKRELEELNEQET